jgi:hypothetical protein
MEEYLNDHKSFGIAADVNGQMLLPFSEMIALFPYMLRSLRISNIFKVRDQYCNNGDLNVRQIRKWHEKRVIKWFFVALVVDVLFISLIKLIKDLHLYSYNSLHQP